MRFSRLAGRAVSSIPPCASFPWRSALRQFLRQLQRLYRMYQYDYKEHEKREAQRQNMAAGGGTRPGYTKLVDVEAKNALPFTWGGSAAQASHSKSKKRHIDDDEDEAYLNEEEEPDAGLAYQPAPDSPVNKEAEEASDEEDPLDAFMAGVEVQAKRDKESTAKKAKATPAEPKEEVKDKKQLGRTDIDGEEDMEESYYNFLEERKKNEDDDDDDIYDYDEEGNPIRSKRIIDPLPPVDHAAMDYPSFTKNFYVPHSDIESLNKTQVVALRHTLGLSVSLLPSLESGSEGGGVEVSGMEVPKPVSSFAHFGFDSSLMEAIRKCEYTKPTPIQAQAVPAALSGRDLIGIAKTGSGKTAGYLWPALVHIMDQPELKPQDGPIALVAVPTRELAIQVYNEAKKFGKVYNINVVCAYGGGNKWEQTKALGEGAELVVCTPGRIIDMVKIGATNFDRTTFIVFDEADKMFTLGFEPQVRSIADHVRPDRQCLMFSATFKKKVEKLARDVLTDPVRIIQGELGEANADIEQHVEVLANPGAKWPWLTSRLVTFCSSGKVLIFVSKKQNADELADSLKGKDMKPLLLHGDIHQSERNKVIQTFRKDPNHPVMVATDVAARGLDIPTIRTVINYDVARDLDTHVHRIGRTGRAGEKGTAYTLVIEADKEFAGHLVRNLESVNQRVPPKLMELANQSSWFRNSRHKNEGPKRIGGAGLGFKARPGLGNSSSTGPSTSSFLASGSNSIAMGQSTFWTSNRRGGAGVQSPPGARELLLHGPLHLLLPRFRLKQHRHGSEHFLDVQSAGRGWGSKPARVSGTPPPRAPPPPPSSLPAQTASPWVRALSGRPIGGAGLGFKARPGLGNSSSTGPSTSSFLASGSNSIAMGQSTFWTSNRRGGAGVQSPPGSRELLLHGPLHLLLPRFRLKQHRHGSEHFLDVQSAGRGWGSKPARVSGTPPPRAPPPPPSSLPAQTASPWVRALSGRPIGGAGLGFKARPGLGNSSSTGPSTSSFLASGSNSIAMGTKAPNPLEMKLKPGTGTNRVATLKAAFHNSFSNQFTAASDDTAWKASKASDSGKKRKSRWE